MDLGLLRTVTGRRRRTHQVVLQGVGPDVVFDDLSQLVRASVRVVGEPGEEALRLLVLPLLTSLVGALTSTLRQVLEGTWRSTDRQTHKEELIPSPQTQLRPISIEVTPDWSALSR